MNFFDAIPSWALKQQETEQAKAEPPAPYKVPSPSEVFAMADEAAAPVEPVKRLGRPPGSGKKA